MIAKENNIVQFERDGMMLRGKVLFIYENSVCVDLSSCMDCTKLELPERTVVNHRNYEIME